MSTAESAPTQKILPFYLLLDVSASMSGDRLEAADKIMPSIIDAIEQNPILSDKIRFGLIDFGSDAQVRLPLCDPLDENLALPGLKVRGATSYSSAFHLLRKEIETNVTQLKADGYAVHRPVVFMLSDGEPTEPEEDWEAAFGKLTSKDFRFYPNVLPCGVAEANGSILRKLIHPSTGPKQMKMYLMDEGQNAAEAITAMAEILISSMVQSGTNVEGDGLVLVVPDKEDVPDGIKAVAADDPDWL